MDFIYPKLPDKNINREYNQKYSLKPIHIIINILCLSRSSTNFKKKLQSLLYITIIITGMSYILYKRLQVIYAIFPQVVVIIDSICFVIVVIMSTIFIFCGGFINNPEFGTSGKKFMRIDTLLNIDNFSFYENLRARVSTLLISSAFLFIFVCSYDLYTWYTVLGVEQGLMYIPVYTLVYINTVNLNYFMVYAYFVWARLVLINKKIEAYYPVLRDPFKVEDLSIAERMNEVLRGRRKLEKMAVGFTGSLRNIDNLINAHKLCCELSNTLNEVFSLQVTCFTLFYKL